MRCPELAGSSNLDYCTDVLFILSSLVQQEWSSDSHDVASHHGVLAVPGDHEPVKGLL